MKTRASAKAKIRTGKKQKAWAHKGEVKIAGSLVTLRGQTARNAKKICKARGVPLKVLMNETMRVFIALAKTEKAKRIQDFHWPKYRAALFKRLGAWKQKHAKPVWNSIPETLTDGWRFGSYTRYADPKGCCDGDGFVIAPDGQRAELDWSVGTGKLKRTSRSDKRIWGVFEVGFPRPVRNKQDLVENFRAVLPQIKTAFARHQKRRAPASRKPPVRDISADGQLEVRGNGIFIYEPLASELAEICKREKITIRQFVIGAAWEELKRDKAAKKKRGSIRV